MVAVYDAALGRFISRDSIGEAGGVNLYGYVGNKPINSTDPDGTVDPVTATVGGALVVTGEIALGIAFGGEIAAIGAVVGISAGIGWLASQGNHDPQASTTVGSNFALFPDPDATNFDDCVASCGKQHNALFGLAPLFILDKAFDRCVNECNDRFPPPTGGGTTCPIRPPKKNAA